MLIHLEILVVFSLLILGICLLYRTSVFWVRQSYSFYQRTKVLGEYDDHELQKLKRMFYQMQREWRRRVIPTLILYVLVVAATSTRLSHLLTSL